MLCPSFLLHVSCKTFIKILDLSKTVSSCLHECVNIGIGLDISHLLPPWKLGQHICQHNRNLMKWWIHQLNMQVLQNLQVAEMNQFPVSSKNKSCPSWLIVQNHTKATANTLTARREFKRLPDSHLPNVKIMLADIRCCPLRHKLVHPIPIVGHFAWNLLNCFDPITQRM